MLPKKVVSSAGVTAAISTRALVSDIYLLGLILLPFLCASVGLMCLFYRRARLHIGVCGLGSRNRTAPGE